MPAAARRFEDVIAWQKARALTKAIYEVTQQNALAKDWGLTSQMQRASVSIMANIAEGFERGRPREYLHFLAIAKPSCAEVQSHLYVALDVGYLDRSAFTRLRERADEVARIIAGLRTAIAQAQIPT